MPESVSKKITKKSTWRKYQRHVSTKRRVYFGVVVLLILAMVVLTGKTINFLIGSGKTVGGVSHSHSWNGNSTINLVVREKTLAVVSYNPVDNSMVVANVPDDTYLTVPGGFGNWPARSIYDLGQGENPPIGVKLLEGTVSNTFGIPIDGFLGVGGAYSQTSFAETIKSLRQNPLIFLSVVEKTKTDLNLWDELRLFWGMRGVRFDKLKMIDLGQSNITESILLPDGSRSLAFDIVKLDKFIRDQFADSNMVSEGLSVAIFNSTDRSGLAEKAARLVTNIGGRVILTSNSSEKLSKSTITGRKSFTFGRLAQIFAPDCLGSLTWLLDKGNVCSGARTDPRADIVIILGEDYTN